MNGDAIRWKPEQAYSTPLFACTLLLGSFTTTLCLNIIYDGMTPLLNAAVILSLAILMSIAFAGRFHIADFFRTLEYNEHLLAVLFGLSFFAIPTLILRRWVFLEGLLALQIPAAATLVSARGFARYYILCGLTCALTVTSLDSYPAMILIGAFSLLLVPQLAYDHFYHAVEGRGGVEGQRVMMPLALSLVAAALACVITIPIFLVTPRLPPFLLVARRREPEAPPGPIDFNMSLIEAFLYTIVLIILLIALAAFLRWIRNRARRKGNLMPESIGVPVGLAKKLIPEVAKERTPDPDDPREVIFRYYDKLARDIRNDELRRETYLTPHEYKLRLLERIPTSTFGMDDITRDFTKARYSSETISMSEAREFAVEVTELINRLNNVDDEQ